METNQHNCPWCGFEYPTETRACPRCGWSRRGSNGRRAMWVYIGFIIFMFLCGGGVLIYTIKQVSSPTNSLTGTSGREGVQK